MAPFTRLLVDPVHRRELPPVPAGRLQRVHSLDHRNGTISPHFSFEATCVTFLRKATVFIAQIHIEQHGWIPFGENGSSGHSEY